MEWTDATVVTNDDGRPSLEICGTVLARASDLAVDSFHLSLSHDAGVASAVVIAEG
jgi:holo-[acyl-carrier protein] synthase